MNPTLTSLWSAGRFYGQCIAVELTYRAGLIQVFFAETIAIFGVCLFWLEAASGATSTFGYGASTLIAYFLIISLQEFTLVNRVGYHLSTEIRMGKMSASLVRPVPYLLLQVARALAISTTRIILMVPVVFAAIYLLPQLIAEPLADFSDRWFMYVLALALGIFMDIVAKMCLGMLAFSMTQTWGPELLFISAYSTAAGILYPVDLLPSFWLKVNQLLPFYYMQGFPALVFCGRLSGAEFWLEFLQGLIVLVCAVFVAIFMWRRGQNKYEAVGI